MALIDFTEIPAEGDRWMHFAQDFMRILGFHIESPPFRDSENQFDFCAIEQIRGTFNYHPFRWLVSCRHKAATRTAVKETEELDIQERVLRSKADGFIGFYSTPISSALGFHLSELKGRGPIKDFKVFEPKSLESYLTTPGFGRVANRYFPAYAKLRRCIQTIHDEYMPIKCDHCGNDLLETLFSEDQQGVVVRLRRRKKTPDEMEVISDVYFACKGVCDEQLQNVYCNGTLLSAASWSSLADLVMPPVFLERICLLLEQIGKDETAFAPQALSKELYLIRALAQTALRESSEGEIQRAKKLMFKG